MHGFNIQTFCSVDLMSCISRSHNDLLFLSNSTCIHQSIQPQIKEENKPVATTVPPPPLSALPGGFLKQLVRQTEKETKEKEPESKGEERPVSVSCDTSENKFSKLLKGMVDD